jgi:O-antigen/teichoic acid export membrane protein
MRNELLKLARGSSFVFACRLTGAVLVFLTQILLARWMGAAELGIYVLAFSWCSLLAIIAGLGYPTASLRIIGHCLAHDDRHHIRGFIRQAATAVLLVVLFWAIWLHTLVVRHLEINPSLFAFSRKFRRPSH